MDIKNEINNLLIKVGKEQTILNYVYNNDENFIAGKTPVYYSGPYWDEQELVVAIESLLVGKWISSGEKVSLFEQKFARKINQSCGVMVNSGSSANLVMLAALKKYFDWDDEDEIIVSIVGFPTTIAPIIQNKLKPVFIDIEMDTLNFDINAIREKITDRTKAIFVSPVLGNPPDMDKLQEICRLFELQLVLDCCDSLGSEWNNNPLSDYAVASSFSFYPAHHISTGEGGMVTSNNKQIIKIARSFSWWGRDCYCVGSANLLPFGTCNNRFSNWLEDYDGIIDHKYVYVNAGYNLKPLDMQGAIGLIQLEKLDDIHIKRKASHKIITDLFKKYIKELKFPEEHSLAKVSWFGTAVICPGKEVKHKLVDYLEKNKIQTRNYFAGNVLLHPAFKFLGNYKDYPNANQVLDLVFFIGAAPHYGINVFKYIEAVLKEYK